LREGNGGRRAPGRVRRAPRDVGDIGGVSVGRLGSAPTWVRGDGIPIVAAAPDLANDALLAPIVRTAFGWEYAGVAWSGASSAAAVGDGGTCGDWSTEAGAGLASAIEALATDFTIPYFGNERVQCSLPAHVYCFQR
jgi:hypothetical protein